jgi:glycerol-3-phosphate cytidylyltransferase-like family protein
MHPGHIETFKKAKELSDYYKEQSDDNYKELSDDGIR